MADRFHFRFFSFVILACCLLTGCATTHYTYEDGQTLTGLASWYGSEQGRHTASGERFNPHAMTAAHRHLPFGTIVLVTNEQNGCSCEVRINDRGPWTDDGRIIDVTSAAADVLQMKGAGVVPVEVEVVSVGHDHYRKSNYGMGSEPALPVVATDPQ